MSGFFGGHSAYSSVQTSRLIVADRDWTVRQIFRIWWNLTKNNGWYIFDMIFPSAMCWVSHPIHVPTQQLHSTQQASATPSAVKSASVCTIAGMRRRHEDALGAYIMQEHLTAFCSHHVSQWNNSAIDNCMNAWQTNHETRQVIVLMGQGAEWRPAIHQCRSQKLLWLTSPVDRSMQMMVGN